MKCRVCVILKHLFKKTKTENKNHPLDIPKCMVFPMGFFHVFLTSGRADTRDASGRRLSWEGFGSKSLVFTPWSFSLWKVPFISSTVGMSDESRKHSLHFRTRPSGKKEILAAITDLFMPLSLFTFSVSTYSVLCIPHRTEITWYLSFSV